jgi:hypothetical protein
MAMKSPEQRRKEVLEVMATAKPLPPDVVFVPYDPEVSLHSRRHRARPEDELEEEVPPTTTPAPASTRTARKPSTSVNMK